MSLRPLHIWQTDKDGNVVRDDDGDPIPLKTSDPKYGQPKKDSELSAGERRFMAKQRAEEEEFLVRRGRAERDRAVLRQIGAEAVAADEAE